MWVWIIMHFTLSLRWSHPTSTAQRPSSGIQHRSRMSVMSCITLVSYYMFCALCLADCIQQGGKAEEPSLVPVTKGKQKLKLLN